VAFTLSLSLPSQTPSLSRGLLHQRSQQLSLQCASSSEDGGGSPIPHRRHTHDERCRDGTRGSLVRVSHPTQVNMPNRNVHDLIYVVQVQTGTLHELFHLSYTWYKWREPPCRNAFVDRPVKSRPSSEIQRSRCCTWDAERYVWCVRQPESLASARLSIGSWQARRSARFRLLGKFFGEEFNQLGINLVSTNSGSEELASEYARPWRMERRDSSRMMNPDLRLAECDPGRGPCLGRKWRQQLHQPHPRAAKP